MQSEAQIEGLDCLKDLRDLPSPSTTSLEVITPPAITLKVLNTAKELGTPSIWLQPGAEDAAVVQYIRVRIFHAWMISIEATQDEKLEDRVIYGGPCILVLGDRLRAEAKL